MVLSFSNPLMEAAWFAWQQENAWGRTGACAVSTQTKANLELHSEGEGQRNRFAIPHWMGTSVYGPRLLWQFALGII